MATTCFFNSYRIHEEKTAAEKPGVHIAKIKKFSFPEYISSFKKGKKVQKSENDT